MHEMSIATALVDRIREEAHRRDAIRVAAAGVRIGAYSGVNADSLRFCFEVLVAEEGLAPLALTIEDAAGEELDLAWLELEETAEAEANEEELPT
jgi:hydrogenase nickel incorporation protein HypA/HybF